MSTVPINARKKCYFECNVVGPLHHFPKPDRDTERFLAWKAMLGNDTKEKGNTYVYNQLRLCNKHFENRYKSPSNRLTRNAIPTLYCFKEPPIEDYRSDSSCGDALDDYINTLRQRLRARKHSVKDSLIIKSFKKRIIALIKKCKTQRSRIQIALRLSQSKCFINFIENLPDSVKTFMRKQLKQKVKRRKFTLEEKIMSASIFMQSPNSYNFLRRLIVLPSKRTIQRLLSAFSIKPGINKRVIQNLKAAVKNDPLKKRLYTLLFDEVALTPKLYFNQKEIIGFESFGQRKTKNIADHAVVFMIKGVKLKTKQPILFTFSKSITRKFYLKKLLMATIKELKKVGIIIVATICDHATSNVSTIKMLQNETKEKYLLEKKTYHSNAFEVDDLKIFPLFDPPHLLKGLRNHFMARNIKYVQDNKEKIAKWEHLIMLLNEDKGEDGERILNKLTEYHVDPKKLPKRKVKYAAQVFSQQVSGAMRFLAKHKILPAESEDTADLLLMFDKLFDSFNGTTHHDATKVLKGCLKNGSPHFRFWDQIMSVLNTIRFEKVIKYNDGTETVQYKKLQTIQSWIHNINTFKEMWKYLNEEFKIRKLSIGDFNQDLLENFINCIRNNGVKPTCNQFMNAYKTLLINNLKSPHCNNREQDDYKQLQSVNIILSQKNNSFDPPDFGEVDSLISTMQEISSTDSILYDEAKEYVLIYVLNKSKTEIFKKCTYCLNNLTKIDTNPDTLNYEMVYTEISLSDACEEFVQLLGEIYFTIVSCLRNSPEISNLKEKVVFFIHCRCDLSIIDCDKHKLLLIDYLINLSINLIVKIWCTGVNGILLGKIVVFDEKDKIKLAAYNYRKSRRKQK